MAWLISLMQMIIRKVLAMSVMLLMAQLSIVYVRIKVLDFLALFKLLRIIYKDIIKTFIICLVSS